MAAEALLGFAHSRLTHTNAALGYLSESAFPVYILHQVAIVMIGYGIIQLPLGIAAKYTALLAASVGATLVVYHCAVRRITTLRFLFGMKQKAPVAARVAAPSRAVASVV